MFRAVISFAIQSSQNVISFAGNFDYFYLCDVAYTGDIHLMYGHEYKTGGKTSLIFWDF